jgi:hypothetical protein
MIQYSREIVIESIGRGVLDAPLAAFAKAPARPWDRGHAEALAEAGSGA